MEPVPIFLNDVSYPLVGSEVENRAVVVQLLKTLREVKSIGRPIVLASTVRLVDVPLTTAYRTLAAYAKLLDREWWRFVRGLEQHAPFSVVPRCVSPDMLDHVTGAWEGAQAPLWTLKNNAFLISFPSSQQWQSTVANFSVCACADGTHLSEEVTCKNLSTPDHATHWRSEILDYDLVESASSTIYESNKFRIRMFLRDHEPPHVHVYLLGCSRKWVAKVRFDHLEVMEDKGLSGSLRREILELLAAKREQLIRAWERCRGGLLPNLIN